MSYASSPSPQPARSLAVLQDPSWRRRHSAWLLAPILGLGVFGCIGFLYIAARTGSRRLWITAAVYCAISVPLAVSLTLAPENRPLATVNGLVLMTLWVGGTIHGIIVNRQYLRWRANSRPWYVTGASHAQTAPSPAFYTQPQPAAPLQNLGLDAQQYYAPGQAPASAQPPASAPSAGFAPAPAPAPGPVSAAAAPVHAPFVAVPSPTLSVRPAMPVQPVDVNAADAATLARVPGLDEQWANHIVTVRAERNGFQSMDDFIAAVGIQPHHLMRVRDHITCSATPAAQTPFQTRPSRGRIVDF